MLAREWLFWHTGNVDFLMLTIGAEKMLRTLAVGWAVTILAALIFGWRTRRAGR